jgi:hypothetical protein
MQWCIPNIALSNWIRQEYSVDSTTRVIEDSDLSWQHYQEALRGEPGRMGLPEYTDRLEWYWKIIEASLTIT